MTTKRRDNGWETNWLQNDLKQKGKIGTINNLKKVHKTSSAAFAAVVIKCQGDFFCCHCKTISYGVYACSAKLLGLFQNAPVVEYEYKGEEMVWYYAVKTNKQTV